MVIMILMTNRPFKFSKIKGYAQNVVITSEKIVQMNVSNAVQKNARTYAASPKTILYASRFQPFGQRYTSRRISDSVELNDLAKRFNIGTKHIIAINTQIITKAQSPSLTDFDLLFIFSLLLTICHAHRACEKFYWQATGKIHRLLTETDQLQ